MVASSRDIIASPSPPTSAELQRIAAGDQQTCRALIDRWETLIKLIASAYASWKCPLPDLIQVGRIAVYKAALKYKFERGTPFSHYTKRAIKNAVMQEVTRLSRQWQFESPLDNWVHDVDGQADAPDERIERISKWVESLSEPHATIFRMLYVEGLKQRIVAEKLEVSQPRIAQLHGSLLDLARAVFVG